MKRLILIRHAKSNLNQPLVSDHERILNKTGINEAQLIGQYLHTNNYHPSHIISSTAARTLETSKIITEKINFINKIETQSIIYNKSSLDILSLIHNIDNQYQCVMLIGHNPTITQLTNQVSNLNIDDMPTCGAAIIDFKCDWHSIEGNGNLIDCVWPKKLN